VRFVAFLQNLWKRKDAPPLRHFLRPSMFVDSISSIVAMGTVDDDPISLGNRGGNAAVDAHRGLARLASRSTSGRRLLTGLRLLNRKLNQPDQTVSKQN
jgi:hypothetical protein